MCKVLYMVFERECLINQTIYSILSLIDEVREQDNLIITILTNFSKEKFENILFLKNLRIDIIDDAELDTWKQNGYIYNVKIFGIMYYFEKYRENVLFIDSDTIVMKEPDMIYREISKNKCFLNCKYKKLKEYFDLQYVADKRRKIDLNELNKAIRFYNSFKNSQYIMNNRKYEISPEFCYYNSGVIGLAYENRYILNEVYDLCNILWNEYQFVMSEEFAYSYILTKEKKQIFETKDLLIHYYSFKWIRFLAAMVQNVYIGNDEEIAKQFMKTLKIKDNLSLELKKNEIPYLVAFIRKRVGMKEGHLGYIDMPNDISAFRAFRKFQTIFSDYSEVDIVNIYYYLQSLCG